MLYSPSKLRIHPRVTTYIPTCFIEAKIKPGAKKSAYTYTKYMVLGFSGGVNSNFEVILIFVYLSPPQAMWHSHLAVGCGYYICPQIYNSEGVPLDKNAKYFVCNYSPQ
jgi:hypothetical protein